MKAAFLIAAPTSGSGKTTIARGLMALLVRKGYTVQPFKCGPDYIDTKFHEAVCRRPSINLDTFMATPEHVRELFAHYGQDADVCIVEGMMGLYDGYDRDLGSTAEIARVLDIPVVLVVDAKSAAYSMAPLLYGFTHFSSPTSLLPPPSSLLPPLNIAGVIFNKVGSERHFQMLQQVCHDVGVECLGYLPKNTSLETGSRYLGLDFSEKAESTALVSLLEEHVNWPQLVGHASQRDNAAGHASQRDLLTDDCRTRKRDLLRVMVAHNGESFSFIYQETIDHHGDITFFDPEKDVPNPDDIDLLYLPGGYPEKHLEALVANEACRKAIKDYAERGGRIIAECGGMMYLCRSIVPDGVVGNASQRCNDGALLQRWEALPTTEYPMCGVLPYTITARKADRRLSLGYRRFVLDGKEYRGHEFHYTQFLGETPKSIVQVYNAKGEPVDTPVFRYKNVFASYTHLYANYEL